LNAVTFTFTVTVAAIVIIEQFNFASPFTGESS